MSERYHGYLTTADGRHLALSADDARALLESIEAAEAKSAADMPDTAAALAALCRAKERLRRLDWSDGIYCPKDGREFALVQFGSTGIFSGVYRGTWPDGDIDAGDWSQAPEGCMLKALDRLTEAERASLERGIADHASWLDRLGRSLAEP